MLDYFNPRTPVGCDCIKQRVWARLYEFQSTHPSGVRPVPVRPPPGLPRYFNPRTPVGCDGGRGRGSEDRHLISIHAPQWGATPIRRVHWEFQRISIHAPQWGATFSGGSRVVIMLNFNPRTPVGCDLSEAEVSVVEHISIHAPQWGATLRTRTGDYRVGYFNPRTPVGCDPIFGIMMYRWNLFQSTHPSGVRLALVRATRWLHYFNPRTPVGCDPTARRTAANQPISIHAPQWGATLQHRYCNH